jgi:hypothetical protein
MDPHGLKHANKWLLEEDSMLIASHVLAGDKCTTISSPLPLLSLNDPQAAVRDFMSKSLNTRYYCLTALYWRIFGFLLALRGRGLATYERSILKTQSRAEAP